MTKSGAPCNGWRVSGSAFCLSHDPEHAAAVAESRRRGGRARHGRRIGETGKAAAVTLTGPGDVLRVIGSEVNQVLQLEASISRARCVAYLCGVFVTTWESSELEARVAALEGRMNEQP